MVNQQLLDYIKQQLQQGISKEQIKSSLIAEGWQGQDIEEAFSFIENSVSQSPSVPPSTQTISFLPSARAILGQAWAIYKQRLGTFLGIMVIPMLIITVSSVILAAGRGFLGIPIFIISLWGQTALLYAIKDNQERIGVIESYRRGWHKILSYLWVSLLVLFIIMGGLLLLIVPGIIFAVWFGLAIYILIAEDLKGMNALLKSREYVKGKWGSVFWRFFFIFAISGIISLVLNLIFNFLKIPFGKEISNFIIGLFLTPLTMTYGFLVYSNLKALKGEIAFAPSGSQKIKFVLVGIIGILLIPAILFSIFFLILGSAREKARDIRRQADIIQIQTGLKMYYSKHNSYPFSLNELSPEYLPDIPLDPSTHQPYQYQLEQNGIDYKLCAQLESTKTQKCVSSQ